MVGRAPTIQPRLVVGPAGDRYEQEAEQVARRVVQGMHPPAPHTAEQGSAVRRSASEETRGAALRLQRLTPQHSAHTFVAPGWESSLRVERGGGRPLAESVRGPMEQAFGADFGGVRVHTDARSEQLNRAIQAEAFTTGRDIFFGHGAYRPETHAGRELLAHELTHVVQQGGGEPQGASEGPAPVVQRKVGFEFETDVKLATTPTHRAVPYGVQVFASTDGDWQIKSDNSKVEFVTKEVEESDSGLLRLAGVMGQVTGWARSMSQLTKTAMPPKTGRVQDVRPSLGDAKQYLSEDVVLDNAPIEADAVTAAPQATGGVTLDKIPQLVEKMVDVKLEHLKSSKTFKPKHEPPTPTGDDFSDELNQLVYDASTKTSVEALGHQGYETKDISYAVGGETLIGMGYLTYAKHAVETWLKWVESLDGRAKEGFEDEAGIPVATFREQTGKLQGLMVLAISYLHGGSGSDKPIPYTKAAAVLMSRTNLHALYQLLSAEEKQFFVPEGILFVAQLKDDRLFRGGFNSRGRAVTGPKRSEWLESIAKGTPAPVETGVVLSGPQPNLPFDRLSQGSGTPEARNSSSLGAFVAPDPNPRTGRNELAVLEIRNIPKQQGIDDWMQTALTIFEMFRRLNETAEETEERFARARAWDERLREQARKAKGEPYMYQY